MFLRDFFLEVFRSYSFSEMCRIIFCVYDDVIMSVLNIIDDVIITVWILL